MKKEKIKQIIDNFAHDYRDVAMNEDDLKQMLINFQNEIYGNTNNKSD